jgi:ArsR family transcriptional regulator, arsenate/arsenite/antimonite-responsive transcriptional repressor / arsenate reductase (thioredoxin)
MATSRDAAPPGFLRLAGHPLRWRLLGELTYSDRQVRELTGLLGQPQSLVSYHLGLLRDGGLVSSRRSSADRRDAYYSIDLARCAELITEAGLALHPGLGLVPPAAPVITRPVRVLFLCTGNGARSPVAEALLRQRAGGMVEAASAGSHPKPLHPDAVRVLREYGVDIAGRQARHMDMYAGQHFDYVISLCDRVREVCPDFSGPAAVMHWSIPDPSAAGDDAGSYPAFQAMAADLHTRIGFLLARIAGATGR